MACWPGRATGFCALKNPVAGRWLWSSGHSVSRGGAGFPFFVFRKRQLGTGLAICVGLIMMSGASICTAHKVDCKAASMQVPFFVWLVFATCIQEEIWRRN
uniref:tryptophan-rich sensory protein n=1 Tax=Gluconobacter sphaericus TaxID=574987 RepID=UPI0021012018|nr:TspO/MBR family protein [Gluconobacter sphaericus]